MLPPASGKQGVGALAVKRLPNAVAAVVAAVLVPALHNTLHFMCLAMPVVPGIRAIQQCVVVIVAELR